MMAEIEEKYNISDAVTALGHMMRYSMNWTRQYVMLQDEINYIKNYIAIENIRYEDKLELVIDIDEEVSKQKVMKMLLQPLIENSVNHGLRSKRKDGVIKVTAYNRGDVLYIEVWDNGVGMEESKLEKVRQSICNVIESGPPSNNEILGLQGIALKNIHERIKLFYGNEFGIEIFSKFGEYTKVLIRLPLIKDFGEVNSGAKGTPG